MDRLTHERCNGIKTGYWSAAKKEELIQRLAAYENTGLEPEQIEVMQGHSVALMAELEEREFPWISVEERLPKRTMPPKDVLVYHDLGCGMFIDRAWYSYEKNKWVSTLGMNLKVTHWMPLPEPPEEE